MNLRYIGMMIWGVLLICAGCNNDIFVDDPVPDEGMKATVEGDGGEAVFSIPTKDLCLVDVDVFSEQKINLHYYNAAGEAIGHDAPVHELSKIVFASDFLNYEVLLNWAKQQLTFKSICNPWSSHYNYSIRLEYTYGIRFIKVTILPGKPLELEHVDYFDDLEINDIGDIHSEKSTFHNQGSIPQVFEVWPYLNELASILVEPRPNSRWLYGESLDMPVPMYEGGEWVLKKKSGIRGGIKYTYEGPDRFTKVAVDVPANSSATVTTYVKYSKAVGRGVITYRNVITGLIIPAEFEVTSFYPTGHEINVEINDEK